MRKLSEEEVLTKSTNLQSNLVPKEFWKFYGNCIKDKPAFPNSFAYTRLPSEEKRLFCLVIFGVLFSRYCLWLQMFSLLAFRFPSHPCVIIPMTTKYHDVIRQHVQHRFQIHVKRSRRGEFCKLKGQVSEKTMRFAFLVNRFHTSECA